MTVAPLTSGAGGHVKLLDPLRGMAALGVVLFHYSGSILPTITPNLLTNIFEFGKYGVHVFFIISGFIIPYALTRSGHGLGDLWLFMLRRFVRIAPPAYLAATGVIAFHLSSLWINGRPVDSSDWPGINWRSIVGNLLFHPGPFGTKWFNFPYWTLMIEFQFYFLIGALLPLLYRARSQFIYILVFCAIMASSLIELRYFFFYSPFFMTGASIFLWKDRRISFRVFCIILIVGAALSLVHGLPAFVVAAITSILILADVKLEDRYTSWLGKISYSLYIVHVPVGYFAESAIKRLTDLHTDPLGQLFLLFTYTLLALGAASLFHQIIERPFMEISKRMRTVRKTPGSVITP